MMPFNVISKRSREMRTVYAVTLHELPYFLIYRNGEWIWEESRWYEPADTTHVVHGQWIGEGDGYADGGLVYDIWHCSECNYCIDDGTDDPELLPRFCPNCGAKMNGGTNGKT